MADMRPDSCTAEAVGTQDWQHHSGGGWKAWWACLPFILLAGFSTGMGWAYPEHLEDELGGWWYYISLASSIGSVLLGLLVLSFRTGASIDPASGEVTAWWGLFGRWFQRYRSLDDFTAVVLDRHRPGKLRKTRTYFAIQLEGADHELILVRTHDYGEARRNADQIALLTGLRYLDRTEGAEQEREPERLIAEFFGR